MKNYDELIIAQLVENGELGFIDLLRCIHDYQKEHSEKEYAGHNSKLSKLTLQRRLKSLLDSGVVQKKKGRTEKREVFALTEKSGEYVFSNILVEFAQLKNTLDFYDKKPFFGFFDPAHFDGAPAKEQALKELSNALHELSERIDGYLKNGVVE